MQKYTELWINPNSKLINQHLDGKENRRLFIWSLPIEEWNNIYGQIIFYILNAIEIYFIKLWWEKYY